MAPRRKREPFGLAPIKLKPFQSSAASPLAIGSSGFTLPKNWRDIDVSSDDGNDPFDVLKGAGKIGLDILSAGGRVVGGTIAEGKKDGFQLTDIAKGFTKIADDDYDPSDVLKSDSFLESLLVDVALDPLTYASLGLVGAGKAATLAGAKGAGKLAKGADKASKAAKAGKSIKEEGLFDRVRIDTEDAIRSEKELLSENKKALAKVEERYNKAPRNKDQRLKMRRQAQKKEDEAYELRASARGKQRSIDPSSQVPIRMRLDEIYDSISAARSEAIASSATAREVASRQIDDATSALRPGGNTAPDLEKRQLALQKEIAKKEAVRNKTKAGSVERGRLNDELYQLRAERAANSKALNAATNPKSIKRNAKKELEAEEALRAADDLIERASTDTVTGSKVFDLGNIARTSSAPVNATVKGTMQAARRSSDRYVKLTEEARELEKQIVSADDAARLTRESDEGFQAAEGLTQQAQDLRSLADTDTTKLKGDLDSATSAVDSSTERLRALEEQFNLLQNSSTVEEAAAIQQRLMNLVDKPAMRDLAPDIVQRKLMFAPMGIRLPGGLSEKIAIPLGRPYSKAERRAAFDERFPGLSKIRDQLGETFNPIYKISPLLADLERGRSNMARADADRFIGKAQDYRNIISAEERSRINRLLVEADEVGLDLATKDSRIAALNAKDVAEARRRVEEARALSDDTPVDAAREALETAPVGSRTKAQDTLNESRRAQRLADEAGRLLAEAEEASALRATLLEQFDDLSDNAKEAIEFVLQTYRRDAEIDFALGFIKNIKEGYSARLRPLKGDAQQVMRVNDAAIYQEKGFTKARKGGAPEEEIDFLEAFALRQIQAAQMRQGYGMVNSLSNEVGRIFKSEADATAAGYIRPEKGKAAEWLGDNVYIPREVADSLDRIHEVWSSPRAINSFTRKWGILNGMFKNVAYTINPGHFLIDSIGDTWNMWLARVPIFDPRYMSSSLRIAKDIENYERAVLRGQVPSKKTVRIGRTDVDLQDLVTMLDAKGLRNRGRSAGRSGVFDNEAGEWFARDPRFFGKLNPRRVARGTSGLMQKGGNLRDNTFRSYGMIAQLQKNLDDGMEYSLALNSAGNTVRFSTFDYNDLTSTEKRIFRNVMPFYTWTRKNIPYQLNRLMAVPGRVTLPFKAQEASFNQEGAPDLSLMQPFTRDTNFLLPGGIAGLLPGMDEASVFMNPMIPSMDLGRFQTYRIDGEEGPIPGLDITEPIGMLSPYIKAIPELGMNREFFSGREIGSAPSYIFRTFLGQPGGQVVKQLSPDTPGYETVEVGPTEMRLNQILGLTGQFAGFRGYALEEGPASAARAARLQAIQMRKSAKEDARREAGNLFSLPLIGVDVPNPFYY